MATSSITKNFIISGQKQVEMFADAIEASANDRTPRVPINVTYLQGADDIIHFLRREMLDFTAFPVFFVSNLLLVQRKKYYFNRATVSRNCSIVL